jgi:hypothetical protein
MSQPTVFGWKAPGGDSEELTVPYRIWYRLYRAIRTVKHRLGLHDWREQGVVEYDDPVYARRHLHCDWCGASKPAKARRS